MREYAFDIIKGTLEEEGHSDTLFRDVLKKNSELTSTQKKYLKRVAYGTIERQIELDARISQFSKISVMQMDSDVRTVLRLAVYEIFHMEQVPDSAACNEAVNVIRKKKKEKYAGFVNGVLRNLIRNKDSIELKGDWIAVCLPKPLMVHLTEQYGKKTAKKIGNAFLERSGTVTLHIQTDRISVEEYEKLLHEHKVVFTPGYYMKDALILTGVNDVSTLPGYQEGFFFVQDESSMLPAMCAGIKPGDTIVDICSAPGGKALHALQMLQGEGFLSARDISEKKVHKIRENINRMNYKNVECKVWDATKDDVAWKEKADVILADVPCSGIGIIGRKPEIKYRAMDEIESLVPIQREICKRAVTMLKPGVTFIYSTCTISKKENEENVHWLIENLGLKPDCLDKYLPETLHNKMTAEGMLQMLPGVQKSDGFFVARLIKG